MVTKDDVKERVQRLTAETVVMILIVMIVGFSFIWSLMAIGLEAAAGTLGAMGSFTTLIAFWFRKVEDKERRKEETTPEVKEVDVNA